MTAQPDNTPPAKPTQPGGFDLRLLIMLLAAAACFLPWIKPPYALGIGILLALLGLTTRTKQAGKLAKLLIQVAVVMLGLGMDLKQVGQAGVVGLAFAAGTIVGTFALGIVLGRLLKIDAKLTTLLSSGTAICGGSAIAATASVIAATEASIAVAMGAVFILNAVALFVFPWIGAAMHMTQVQFGTWAAVAVHDIASVLGTAETFDTTFKSLDHPRLAYETATAVKLTRALWIVPVSLACGWWFGRGQPAPAAAKKWKSPIPLFILLFVVAATVGTYVPAFHQWAEFGKPVSARFMTIALLLIGCCLSPKAVAHVGWRAMVMAVVLWVAISVAALWVVMRTV